MSTELLQIEIAILRKELEAKKGIKFPSRESMIQDLYKQHSKPSLLELYNSSDYTDSDIRYDWLLQTTPGIDFGIDNWLVAFRTSPVGVYELTSEGEKLFGITARKPVASPPTAKVVGDFILNNWGKPAPKPAKPKHVNVGFAGETQVRVREYVRDTSNPMKRVPPRVSKHTPAEVVYARLEDDRKAREARK